MEKSAAINNNLNMGFSLETSHLNQLTDDDFEILTDRSGSQFIKLSQMKGVTLIDAHARNDNFWGVRLDFPDSKSVYLKLWYRSETVARHVQESLLTLKREELEKLALLRKNNLARKKADEEEIRARASKLAETPPALPKKTGGFIRVFIQRLMR